MSESTLAQLLASLGTIVMQRLPEGSFAMVSDIPNWFSRLYLQEEIEQNGSMLEEQSPFLRDFLLLAEPFWQTNSAGRLKSGPWTEVDSVGKEYRLEASAVCLGTARILLIESFGLEFDERKYLLQKARESNLAQEQLTKEIQDKKTLVQCIAYDMAESLVGINRFFSLLNPGKLSIAEKQSLEISRRQTKNLEKLIHELIEVYTSHEEETEEKT